MPERKSRVNLSIANTVLVTLLLATSVSGAQEVARFPIINAPPKTPGLGAAWRVGHDNYVGEDSRTDLIPLYLYEGKYIFAHGTSLGVHVFRNDLFTFDVLARARFNRLDPDNNELLQGLSKRRQSVDAGISFGLRGRLGELQLTGVTDVLDNSNGSEIDLSYRFPISRRNWGFTPFASIVLQDSDLTQYYFGVPPDEATPERPAYQPGNALNIVWGLNTSYHFSDKFFVFANIAFEGLDSEIANSPIVRSNNNAYGAVGATYLFGDQKRYGTDYDRIEQFKDIPRWSYRVHYARQIHQNIWALPMAGYFTWSNRTPGLHPEQAGLTISRLVQPGERVDFFARFGLFRHLEEPFQDDFWSYNFYMSAMFKVYSNWTDRVMFRWGFSFGVSYAEELPAEEVSKFVNRGKNSSHLLNYLEFQIDFPLDLLIRSKVVRDCYLGYIVTHRSGIFGTSDLLGNVAGGADWAGLHLECMR